MCFSKNPNFSHSNYVLMFLIKNILMGRNYSPNLEIRILREGMKSSCPGDASVEKKNVAVLWGIL